MKHSREEIAGMMFSVAVIVGWGILLGVMMGFALTQFWALLRTWL